jgi:hypothetical protein
MKTIIKLLLVLAICNALARGAIAYWNYYEFMDSAQQAILFAGRSSSAQVHGEIMDLAGEYQIPLRPEDLRVRRSGTRRMANASYVQPIELFPNYIYPATFSFALTAYAPGGVGPDDVK